MSVPEGFLICDTPPGPVGFIVTRQAMTAAAVDRLKRLWQDAYSATGRSSAAIIGDDVTMQSASAGGERQWPDAEFCAA